MFCFSLVGEVHFKVKMTTSMGKLKKSYAERQGKTKKIHSKFPSIEFFSYLGVAVGSLR